VASQKQTRLTTLTRVGILTALYFLGGLLGKKSAFLSGGVPLVWPPAGIALAAILLFGWRFWPVVALGAILFCAVDGVRPGCFMVGIAVGNTLAALACDFLLKRFAKFQNQMARARDAAFFLIVAGALGAVVNAAGNVAGLVGSGQGTWAQFYPLASAWWLPNALSLLIVAPVIVTWIAPSPERLNFFRIAEALLCVAGVVASNLIFFGCWTTHGQQVFSLPYAPYLFLAWLSARFGARGAASGTLFVSALAFFSLRSAHGPLFTGDAAESLRLATGFIGLVAVANLLLGAAAAERRRTRTELIENGKRLRMVVADQTDLICRFEPDGKLTFVNPAFCNFYAKEEAELLGADFFETLEKSEAQTLRENLQALTPENPVLNFDRHATAAAGYAEWHQCGIRRLRRDDGQVEFQAVMRDISARKRAELDAQEARATLEKMNLQLKMAADESEEAAKLANRANAAKSEFLANMSHEIRTPLTGILGMVELLAQTRLDARQRDFASAAVESANALLHVINDVLDFSKIEAGKMTVAREAFSLREVVDSVLENVATRGAGKKITLAAVIRREIPQRLTGDPVRLRQVLLNLVGNGVKFTERGEVVVRVESLTPSQGKTFFRFEVADTGIGIGADEIKNLFQPFVQVDTSSSRKFGGTGLGLAIARKIVEALGGKIGVRSAPGQGSTFWFELPLEVPSQPASARIFPGLTFLQAIVAAPNASLRESLVAQLNGWGVDCRAVATPAEFSRTLRHELRAAVIPLVICDDEMLERGGAELRRLLAENKDRMYCVLLASPAGSLGADAAGPAGFGNVLLKPVREQPLFDALLAVFAETKIELTQPAEVAAADTKFFEREPAAPKRTAISDLRILVAEDHPFNRKLCQLVLESFGARVVAWALNGREAVEKFQTENCDAILMDCNMPELDGLEATAAIRKIETEKNAPRRVRIIALTANALAGERERCLAAGMDDYLSKPFTGQQLYHALLAAVPPAAVNGDFDPARLEQLCDELDRAAVAEMVGDFTSEMPERLAEIQRHAAEKSWAELERAAHSLKGLGVLFGLQKLSAIFLAIEDAAEAGEPARVQAALANLPAETEAGIRQLRGWLEKQAAKAAA
jgi:PAS domain S-box-containing protein